MLNTPKSSTELFLDILPNINFDNLSALDQDNPLWKSVANDMGFWKELLEKYFAKELGDFEPDSEDDEENSDPSNDFRTTAAYKPENYQQLFLKTFNLYRKFYRQDFPQEITTEESPFLLAALAGDTAQLDKVQRLSEEPERLKKLKDWLYALAAVRGHTIAAELLDNKSYSQLRTLGLYIKHGDVNLVEDFWRKLDPTKNPLIIDAIPTLIADAVENGHVDLIEWVLTVICGKGTVVDKNREAHNSNMLLNRSLFMNHVANHSAVFNWILKREEPEFTIEKNAIPNLFVKAAANGQVDVMKALCKESDQCASKVVQAIEQAGRYQQEKVIEWILKTKHLEINAQTRKILFFNGARDNYCTMLKVFLHSPTTKDIINQTDVENAFLVAVKNCHFATVDMLLNYDISAEILNKGADAASKKNSFAIIKAILEKKCDSLTLETQMAIYIKAATKEQYPILELLKTISLETKEIAFQKAIVSQPKLLEWFLSEDNLSNQTIEDGALLAIRGKHTVALSLLLKYADRFTENAKRLHLTSILMSDDLSFLESYLESVTLDSESIDYLFEFITRKKDITLLDFFWEKYANKLSEKSKEKAFVVIAVKASSIPLIDWFVEKIPSLKETALIEAAKQNQMVVFKRLFNCFEETLTSELKSQILRVNHLDIITVINQYDARQRMKNFYQYVDVVKNYLFNQARAFAKKPSAHPFLMGILGASLLLFTFNLLTIGFTATMLWGSAFSTLITIGVKVRDLYLEKSLLAHKLAILEKVELSVDKQKAFEQGLLASENWQQYLLSYTSLKNWDQYESHAAGLKSGYDKQKNRVEEQSFASSAELKLKSSSNHH